LCPPAWRFRFFELGEGSTLQLSSTTIIEHSKSTVLAIGSSSWKASTAFPEAVKSIVACNEFCVCLLADGTLSVTAIDQAFGISFSAVWHTIEAPRGDHFVHISKLSGASGFLATSQAGFVYAFGSPRKQQDKLNLPMRLIHNDESKPVMFTQPTPSGLFGVLVSGALITVIEPPEEHEPSASTSSGSSVRGALQQTFQRTRVPRTSKCARVIDLLV
jgi:hypothetical protein